VRLLFKLRGDRTSSEKLILVTHNGVIISSSWVAFLNPTYKIAEIAEELDIDITLVNQFVAD
jgi:hypothetical protein